MKKDINKLTVEAIRDELSLKGTSIDFTLEAVKEVKKFTFLEDLNKYEDDGKISICQSGDTMDRVIYLELLSEMLANGEVELKYTDKAKDRNIKYINKLLGDK